jgi:hypothetical protein
MQKLAAQCLRDFSDFEVQIWYKSEQNNTSITTNKPLSNFK